MASQIVEDRFRAILEARMSNPPAEPRNSNLQVAESNASDLELSGVGQHMGTSDPVPHAHHDGIISIDEPNSIDSGKNTGEPSLHVASSSQDFRLEIPQHPEFEMTCEACLILQVRLYHAKYIQMPPEIELWVKLTTLYREHIVHNDHTMSPEPQEWLTRQRIAEELARVNGANTSEPPQQHRVEDAFDEFYGWITLTKNSAAESCTLEPPQEHHCDGEDASHDLFDWDAYENGFQAGNADSHPR
jgi:hypothetical protein